ncbi:uncharacterized protein LOC131180062 [Hevea brasiliensis]|uniref:uncharacterized protein LOC131180062 n=1 Tax=Hevea brasiliensis TaxID=3981 RepID=UPI002600EF27|nr:uncharacterized protein LOC131180062 [Hevea brasiliensis]
MGTKLAYSTAYHPQSDGQSERLNQSMEGYLRCLCYQAPHSWVKWLSLAEWWYNTSYHSALKLSPFEALYGYKPAPLTFLPLENASSSIALRKNFKLVARSYGPFQLEAKVGTVAYKLKLPPNSTVHPVFHVSLLKKKVGDNTVIVQDLPLFQDDTVIVAPEKVLQIRIITRHDQQVLQGLIKWMNLPEEEAT